MLDLSATELRSIAKRMQGGVKGCNNLDKDELLKTILLSTLSFDELKSISNLENLRIIKICLKMNC